MHQTPEGDAAALQGLSLTVREREIVTVLGPSGSGKTTFLRILAGLDRPSAGTVHVFGTELGKLPARDVSRYRAQNVGYADQHYARALAPELTARELIRTEHCTAVIVSHDPESASIADRVVRIRDGRVSEESAGEVGQEAIVVGKGGWLRLPEDLLRRSGIRMHATARLSGRDIVVSGGEAEAETAETGALKPVSGSEPQTFLVAATRALTKSYTARRVFDALDAGFESSTLTAVTGPSGSGKTTLLHLLAGLELPDAGAIEVLDTDLTQLDRAARANLRRDHIGYVGQQPGLVPALSALENVELALALRGLPPARARETLVAVGLEDRAEQRVSRLSTGERGRVAIARALAPRPELLLADEPTSRLDQANAIAVGTLFSRLARELGAAIVCATHDPLLIEQADATLRLG